MNRFVVWSTHTDDGLDRNVVVLANEIDRLRAALGELHALVWGECSSLLNEDSGGDAKLDTEIRSLIRDRRSDETSDIRPDPFVVRHYTADERPIIKGNGFDGLEIGTDREEAQEFVDWINERLGVKAGEST
jgi:hypothetical protein